MRLRILGSSSAIPTEERGLSAQFLHMGKHALLIDCGEGTQMQLRRFGEKWSAIRYVLISHLHGDHYFGLVSLLSTMHMLERDKALDIYAPAGLEEIIRMQFAASHTILRFELNFHIIHTEEQYLLFEENDYRVFAIPLMHSRETYGFLIKEKTALRNIKKSFVAQHQIPYEWFPRIKAGEDYIDASGKRWRNNDITDAPKAPASYAYFSDTAYIPERADDIAGLSVLYHEATFLEEDVDKAELRKHSTARQAANMAKLASAGQLILGHFSTRYPSVEKFEEEAKEIFANTALAFDGMEIEI